MTIHPPSHRKLLYRVLRIAGILLIVGAVVSLFVAANQNSREQVILKASLADLQKEYGANPNDEYVSLVLDERLLQYARDEQAFDLMTQVVKRFPDSARAWDHYAKAAAQTHRVLEAFKGYQEELRIKPGEASARATLGTMYIKAGLISEGLTEIEVAVKSPQHVQINALTWAEALEAKGRDEEAWQVLAEALNAEPTQDGLYPVLTKLAIKLNRFSDTEGMLLRRIFISPQYDMPVVRGAYIDLQLAKSHDADTIESAMIQAKLGANEKSGLAQLPLARVLIIKKDLNGARSVLEAGLKMDKHAAVKTRDTDCVRMLADVEAALGRVEEANKLRAELPRITANTPELISLKTAAEGAPASTPVQLTYAGALERAGEFGRAAEVCASVLARRRDDPGATNMMARCRDEAMSALDSSEKAAAAHSAPVIDERAMHAGN